MPGKNITSLRKAASRAGVSHEAIRLWCERYDIGNFDRESKRWIIDADKLDAVISARSFLKIADRRRGK